MNRQYLGNKPLNQMSFMYRNYQEDHLISRFKRQQQWRIQGWGAHPYITPTPKDQICLNFMQCFGNFGNNYMLATPDGGLAPPPREILDPPLNKASFP